MQEDWAAIGPRKVGKHLTHCLKRPVIRPRARVAPDHQVIDVGVPGGESGNVICAAANGG